MEPACLRERVVATTWSIASTNLLRALAMSFGVLTIAGCAPQWSIQRVNINPAGPLGGVASANPVILVAPAATGGPGGFQNVPIAVQFRRDPNFNGPIYPLITSSYFPPGKIEHSLGSIYFLPLPAGASRFEEDLFQVTCRRVEQGWQSQVELFIQMAAGWNGQVTVPGITQASITITVNVASRTDTANPHDWPVQARGFQLPVSCLRDDPAPPQPQPPIPAPTPPRPQTQQEKCLSDCLGERDACMAEVPTKGGSRPERCVSLLRACRLSCEP